MTAVKPQKTEGEEVPCDQEPVDVDTKIETIRNEVSIISGLTFIAVIFLVVLLFSSAFFWLYEHEEHMDIGEIRRSVKILAKDARFKSAGHDAILKRMSDQDALIQQLIKSNDRMIFKFPNINEDTVNDIVHALFWSGFLTFCFYLLIVILH